MNMTDLVSLKDHLELRESKGILLDREKEKLRILRLVENNVIISRNRKIKQIAIDFKENGKLNTTDIEYLKSTGFNFNPYYLVNPSSWQIMESILQQLFWKVFDGQFKTRPDNWLKLITTI
jgi:hypothetical protein